MTRLSILFLLTILSVPIHLDAETKVWTGLSTNLPPKWDDPDNWKPSVPGERDDVVIGEPPYNTRPQIEVKGPIKIKSLSVNRVTLSGNAQFEVDTLSTKGLTLTGGGAVKILGGAGINNGSGGEYGLAIYGWTINNQGLFTLSANSAIFFLGELGRFNNDGTVDLMDDTVIDGFTGGALFTNRGVMRKPLGTSKSTIEFVDLANEGEILVSAGSLHFPSGHILNTGTMTIDGPNSIVFEGVKLDLNGGALQGAAPFIVRGSTVVSVNVDTPIDNLNLASDITGPAKLTVQNHLDWTGGNLLGSGEVICVSQLTIEDASGAGNKLIRGRTLRNKSKGHWASGNLTVDQGGRMENELTGEFTIGDLADKQMSGSAPDGGGFFNAGIVRLVRQSGRKTSIYCPFHSTNRVEYGAQLLFFGGGSLAGTFAQIGTSPDAHWALLSGTNLLEEGFTSTSSNPVWFSSTVRVQGLAKANQVRLDGGIVEGPGALEVSELFLWSSGLIRGTGVVRALGKFDWGELNALRQLLGRTIEISGQGIWNQVNFEAGDGAIIRVMPGAELLAGASESVSATTGALPVLENHGRFVKGGGAGTGLFTAGFINHGEVVINQGILQFGTAYLQEEGSTRIDAGAALQLSRGMLNGVLGSLSGLGKIIGSVTNLGTIRPGNSPGTLTLGDLSQGKSGHVEVEIGGPQPGVDYDQVKLDGKAALDGMLNIKFVNGFVPTVGTRFEIMTFQSHAGEFAVKNGDYLGNGLILAPEYSNAKLTLVVTQATPLTPTLRPVANSANNSVWSWDTQAGQKYQVESSNDLRSWFIFTNLQPTALTVELELPRPEPDTVSRFYRLR